jgi:hypothetical protein
MINLLSVIILNYIFYKNSNYLLEAILFSLIPNILTFQILNIYNLNSKNNYKIPNWFNLIRNILYSIFVWIIIFLGIFIFNSYNIPMWSLSVITTIIFDILTHNIDYFPTHFLWPFSDLVFNGYDIYNNKLNLGIYYILMILLLINFIE